MTPADHPGAAALAGVALSPLQRSFLEAGVVGYDHQTWPDQVAEINNLVDRGLMTAKDIGSDEQQYTYIQCRITAKGRALLAQGGGNG